MDNVISIGAVSTDGTEMPYACIRHENAVNGRVLAIIPGLSLKPVTPAAEAIGAQYGVFTENGYTIYVFDRRTNAPDGYSIYDMADDTAAVMRKLGIGKADLFGASQGGMISMCMAIRHPELVGRMMLCSTAAKHCGGSDKMIGRWISLAREKKENDLIQAFGTAVYSEPVWNAYRDSIIAANSGITDEEYRRFIIMAKAVSDFDCTDGLRNVANETLAIGAKGDKIFTSAGIEEIARILGCESYIYDEGFGHGVYDEAPDYAERLYRFCAAKQ